MINFKNRGILLGMALLGATAFIGIDSPASAKPKGDKEWKKELKDERKEVKKARKEARKADTPEERREAREDLRDAREDLRRERRENRDDRRDRDDRDDRWDRNDRWDRDSRHDNGRWPKNSNNNGRWGREDWDRNNNGRWDRNERPGGYTPGTNTNVTTLQGLITKDSSGNDFRIRLSDGREVVVTAPRGEPGSLDRGDIVRVAGRYVNGVFVATNISFVLDR